MKLTILQENLSKALNIANKFVSSRAQLPVLSNILFTAEDNKLKLSATNLETGINLWLPAKIDQNGAITVSAKAISEFVSSLPSDKVELKTDVNKFFIQCRNYKANFNGMAAAEFPQISSLKSKKDIKLEKVSLNAKDLVEAINLVAFTAAQDESRPVLTGVKIIFNEKEIQLAATDGYRLSLKTIKLEAPVKLSSLIIPARALMEVSRICSQEKELEKLTVTLAKDANQIIFTFNNVEIITRLIEGEYPDFTKIIPNEKTTQLVVNREELQRAVKTAALFAKDSANIVKLNIKNQILNIAANAPEIGDNEVALEIKQSGEDSQIAFNCRFLQEFLSVYGQEELVLETMGSLKPGVFRVPADATYLHIIMPVRIQE